MIGVGVFGGGKRGECWVRRFFGCGRKVYGLR